MIRKSLPLRFYRFDFTVDFDFVACKLDCCYIIQFFNMIRFSRRRDLVAQDQMSKSTCFDVVDLLQSLAERDLADLTFFCDSCEFVVISLVMAEMVDCKDSKEAKSTEAKVGLQKRACSRPISDFGNKILVQGQCGYVIFDDEIRCTRGHKCNVIDWERLICKW